MSSLLRSEPIAIRQMIGSSRAAAVGFAALAAAWAFGSAPLVVAGAGFLLAAVLSRAWAKVARGSVELERHLVAGVRTEGDELVVRVRDKELHTALTRETLSGSRIPRVALPRYTEDAELLRFLRSENLPGRFPFTAGVFNFKREGEEIGRAHV